MVKGGQQMERREGGDMGEEGLKGGPPGHEADRAQRRELIR